jgi:hypothetical protein
MGARLKVPRNMITFTLETQPAQRSEGADLEVWAPGTWVLVRTIGVRSRGAPISRTPTTRQRS